MKVNDTLNTVEEVVNKFNDLVTLTSEIRRIQSVKCRIKKQRGHKDFTSMMTEILKYEEVLKQARNVLDPKTKTVPNMSETDISQLDYDQVVRALRSIQSKKSLTRWLTDCEGDNEEFRNAVTIEKLLLNRKKEVKPIETDLYIRVTDLQEVIEAIETSSELSVTTILQMLNSLVDNR